MSTADILQLVGTFFTVIFALLLFRIATGHWWCRYGREAMMCAAAAIGAGATVRMLVVPLDMISQTDARIINGFITLGFLLILVQVIYLHRKVHEEEL